MLFLNDYMYIKGVTSDQKVFRPSDWAERLASLSSIFYPDKHIEYIDIDIDLVFSNDFKESETLDIEEFELHKKDYNYSDFLSKIH